MCGVLGIVRLSGRPAADDLSRTEQLLERLRTRGPDDMRIWQGDGAVLGATRLAMSDPVHGAQPRISGDGSLVVLFNGELYNAAGTRRRLIDKGARFDTSCDTETLAALLSLDGVDALRTLDAQYAVACWNRRDRRLTLARDRFGVHPLYYALVSDGVAFGSSARTVADLARRSSVDMRAAELSLVAGGVPAPLSFYKDVFQVRAGHACVLDTSGMRQVPIDPIEFPPAGEEGHLDDERLRSAFDRAVADRCKADAPLGLLLSGGVDSGAVAASAARAGVSLPAYTLQPARGTHDESPAAARVATHCGHPSRVVSVNGVTMASRIADAVGEFGESIWRTGPLGFDLLAEAVARDGVKGVLTGDGADELFCGYDVFKHTLIRRSIGRHPASAGAVRMFDFVESTSGMVRGTEPPEAMAPYHYDRSDVVYSHRPRWQLAGARARAVLSPELRTQDLGRRYIEHVRDEHGAALKALSPLNRARHLELHTMFMPFLISIQSDRPLLHHGVEGRHPFLARDVANLLLSADPRQMVTSRKDKIPLRRVLGGSLLGSTIPTPKIPYEPGWTSLRDAPEFRALCEETLSARALHDSPLFDGRRVNRLRQLALDATHARMGTFGLLLQVLTTQMLVSNG